MANCCEYYPCHENPCINFNCEFCYCPLYHMDCKPMGGSPKRVENVREYVKDCSDCMFPHQSNFMDSPKIRKIIKDLYYKK
jgi:Zn-finger protein